jgi:hypothetical protein
MRFIFRHSSRLQKVTDICRIPKCGKPVRCKELCEQHYGRWRRRGEAGIIEPFKDRYVRTPEEMFAIESKLYELAKEEQPTTCRHLFYRLLSAGSELRISKTEDNYGGTVIRLLSEMRLGKRTFTIPWAWIVDNTRAVQKPTTFSSPAQALETIVEIYRRSLWDNQKERVEIWTEKDAIAGLLYPTTSLYDVPLVPVRGHSLGFLHDCLMDIMATAKPTFIYYFGDTDGWGEEIQENIEKRSREFGVTNTIFTRAAVTRKQIIEYKLPTRPPKGRAGERVSEAVEVDAIDPAVLRQLAEDYILKHCVTRLYLTVRREQEKEKRWLESVIKKAKWG